MPKPPKGQTLSNREKVFCMEYVTDWNGARAAIAAGYSKKTARNIASENLTKPNIRAEIDRILTAKAMQAGEVLARLTEQARASHAPFIRIDDDGFLYFDFSDPEAKKNLHLIKKIKTKRKRLIYGKGEDAETWEGEWVEVELHDSQTALTQLGRHHGLFTDKHDIVVATLTPEQIVEKVTNLLNLAKERKNKNAT